jgi:hypothetical protein
MGDQGLVILTVEMDQVSVGIVEFGFHRHSQQGESVSDKSRALCRGAR